MNCINRITQQEEEHQDTSANNNITCVWVRNGKKAAVITFKQLINEQRQINTLMKFYQFKRN